MNLTLPVVTLAALADSINPCAISVLLLTIGFLFSLQKSRREIIAITSIYIAGIFVTYTLIGLGVLQALTLFGIPKSLSKIGALFIIASGVLSLAEKFIPNFPIHLGLPEFSKPGIAKQMQKASVAAAFGMGILVGLFEFPCTGGPYLMILSLLHDASSRVNGALYLMYYNVVFVLPLVILMLVSSNPVLLQKVQVWRKNNSRSFDIYSSLVMIGLGLVILVVSS